jgi:hypothetical protein
MYLLEKRPDNSYKFTVNKNIELITFNNFKPSILGSAALKSSLYSSDYDLFSKIKYKSLKEAKDKIPYYFKQIISKLENNNKIFFMDFKAGFDPELYQTLNSIKHIKLFYNKKKQFLTNEEYNNIKKINNLDDLKEYTRKIYTLRWTLKDITAGIKKLSNNRKISFIEAITTYNSVIKIDILALIDNEFIEMSNMYEFYIGNEKSEVGSKVLSGIKEDIKNYWEDNKKMKSLKRLFSIAKITKQYKLVDKLINVFNSNIGLLYKTTGDLENVIDLINKGNKKKLQKNKDNINNYIQILKQRLGNIYEFKFSNSYFDELDKITKIKSLNNKINSLEKIIKDFTKLINDNINKYIKYNRINIKKYL